MYGILDLEIRTIGNNTSGPEVIRPALSFSWCLIEMWKEQRARTLELDSPRSESLLCLFLSNCYHES